MKLMLPYSIANSIINRGKEITDVIPEVYGIEYRSNIEKQIVSFVKHFHSPKGIVHSTFYDYLKENQQYILKNNFSYFSATLGAACIDYEVNKFYYENKSEIKTEKELKKIIKNIIGLIKDLLPYINIALENTNYYPYPAYRHICEAPFIREVIEENNIRFVFDLAHALVTCNNLDIDFETYLDFLPMDKCCEIHISSPLFISEYNMWLDTHLYPDLYIAELLDKVLEIVEGKFGLNPFIKIEYYANIDAAIEVNKRLVRRYYGE